MMTTIRKRIFVTLAPLIGGCLAWACVFDARQTVAVADAGKPETIRLRKKPLQGDVTGLEIKVSGNIAGKATLRLMAYGNPYQEQTLGGDILIDWRSDWYADEAEIRYAPDSNTTGTITITYRFLSS